MTRRNWFKSTFAVLGGALGLSWLRAPEPLPQPLTERQIEYLIDATLEEIGPIPFDSGVLRVTDSFTITISR